MTLEDEDEYALFYSEECNVVICPGDDDNDDCIIYVWEVGWRWGMESGREWWRVVERRGTLLISTNFF